MAPPPHTSAVRSRCAVGILHSTSYLNSSWEAHGQKSLLHRNGQVSEERFLFIYRPCAPHDSDGLDIRSERGEKHPSAPGIVPADLSLFGFLA